MFIINSNIWTCTFIWIKRKKNQTQKKIDGVGGNVWGQVCGAKIFATKTCAFGVSLDYSSGVLNTTPPGSTTEYLNSLVLE